MKKGYGTGIAFSLSMHGLLIAVMVTTFEAPKTPRTVVTPTYVNATLLVVEGAPQLEARTDPAPQPAPPPPPPSPPREDREREQDRAAEQRRQEEARRAEQERQQEAARRAEQERRQEEARRAEQQRQEDEARRAEQERKRQEEERRKAEAERQRQEEERRRSEAAVEAERQRREEEQFMQAAVARQAVNTYEGLVQQRIADNWSRPPGARRDMEVELAIRMTPNGQIVDVTVIKSSGSEAFDHSAIQAVRRVDRIPEFQQLDATVFNANFRRFNLRFRPEDLRL